ncbi:MAG: prolipoprotein diacylglyceryl transferase [Ruminococcaceae bacterium]|nr:prolipoprotein diacylglyceryl transferase [Oscillospiraceae bacterium]
MYPFIDLFGIIRLPSYGLCMLLGIALVVLLSRKRCKSVGITFDGTLVIVALTVGFAIAFGWLLYIVTKYSPSGIWERITAGDFDFLNDMGIVFYGGVMGGALGMLIGLKIMKLKLESLEFAIVPFVPFGHAVGRVGCFLAGCCYGMEYDGPFAVHYPGSTKGYFPSQLTEVIFNIIIGIVLINVHKKPRKRFYIVSSYGVMYAVARFLNEFTRGDAVRGVYGGLSTSQWISIGIVALVSVYFMFIKITCKEK